MRIIAGSCRGRIFEAPKGLSTRPTLDRVKEAVFGSVQFQVPGAVVLDLFSGSGNMGLEAASRGQAGWFAWIMILPALLLSAGTERNWG